MGSPTDLAAARSIGCGARAADGAHRLASAHVARCDQRGAVGYEWLSAGARPALDHPMIQGPHVRGPDKKEPFTGKGSV
jgi:hypothetical protein